MIPPLKKLPITRLLPVVVVVLVGGAVGLGLFTFSYGEGGSYLSRDPNACVNCHIMQPQFDSWQKSSHHNVALCVDCHLPHAFVDKWLAKADNGFWHSKGFTLQDFPEPITIREKNRETLQQNCIMCHDALVHELLPAATLAPDAVSCLHCHRSVGHGDSIGLGKFTPIHDSNAPQPHPEKSP